MQDKVIKIDGKYGRKVIYSSVEEINQSNVVDVLNKALQIHSLNEQNIAYLENYYTGSQPIENRVKEVREEINNKIVENRAYEIVEFMTAQNFGEPVQYVRKGKDESKTGDIQQLNKYMFSEDKGSWDIELGRWRSICGTSYRICYPDKTYDKSMDECPFGIDVLNPRDTFVIYSSGLGKRPLMGVYRTKDENNTNVYHCYTRNMYYKIKRNHLLETSINGVGEVLIVEYPNNSRRLGDIEIVISLLDTINKMQSNRMDGIEQFIQAFLVFENCQIDETTFKTMKDLGAIEVKGDVGLPAKVYAIVDQLDQSQLQIAKEDIYESILAVMGLPNRQENSGGDTGAAVVYRNGWQFAEQRAAIGQPIFEKSEKEFLKIALKILSANDTLNLNLSDIEIKVTRSKADNIIVKSQALLYQLQAGIEPSIAIKTCNLYSDPEDVSARSKTAMDAKYGIGSLVKEQINVNGNELNEPLKEVV